MEYTGGWLALFLSTREAGGSKLQPNLHALCDNAWFQNSLKALQVLLRPLPCGHVPLQVGFKSSFPDLDCRQVSPSI